MDIQNAFLREFRVGDLDAVSKSPLTFSFVAVPQQIAVNQSGGNVIPGVKTQVLLASNFKFTVAGVDPSRMRTVSGIRMVWPKIAQQMAGHAGRVLFAPGTPSGGAIAISMSASGGSTAADLDQWMDQVANGNATPRNATLELMNTSLVTVHTVQMNGLFPLQFFPFATSGGSTSIGIRSMTLQLGSFTIQ